MQDSTSAPAGLGGARLATRLAFVAAGFALACWAPLVPFAKARVGADDAQLGLILLCLGIGSVVAMPVTGWLSARLGSRPVLVASGMGTALLLPLLSVAPSAWLLALTLAGFGASLGTLDVAMNVHAVEVERQSGRPLMSGFHAMFSVGGFLGSGGMTVLLSAGVRPAAAVLLGAVLAATAIAFAWPRLLPAQARPAPIAVPHGLVLVLAALAAIMFLVEGAMLDWGALLVLHAGLATAAGAGLGYTLFSIAMTVGRLSGDRTVARLGDGRVVMLGAAVALSGFILLLTARLAPVALAGFLLIGLGAANIVPVLFRLAGRQTVMPVGLAVAALTTAGYAGVLAGPAGIGFVSHAFGLPTAFWLLAALTSLVPLGTWHVSRRLASIDVVVFDLGGVLLDWNPRYLYRQLFQDDVAMERFLSEVCTQDWNERQDAGRPWVEGVAELVARHPDQAELIAAYHERWPETLAGDKPETVEVLKELKERGLRLYALTNWSHEKFPVARGRFPFLEWFDGIVVSGEEGVIKPDPAIFHRLLTRYDIAPSRAVYIDDSPRHVEAAAELGFHALPFLDAQRLRRDLIALGLPLRDGQPSA